MLISKVGLELDGCDRFQFRWSPNRGAVHQDVDSTKVSRCVSLNQLFGNGRVVKRVQSSR